jgi:hypothetical protein
MWTVTVSRPIMACRYEAYSKFLKAGSLMSLCRFGMAFRALVFNLIGIHPPVKQSHT